MDKPKIDPNIQNNLFSGETEKVVAAIQKIKEKGNKDYLPILFDLLLSNAEVEIEKDILKVLGTVKNKETIPVFIDCLQGNKYLSIQKKILAACWQNGLDFSIYLETFVDIVINKEWEVAFEAFTVIENLELNQSQIEMEEINKKIINSLKTASDKKQYFLEEILRLTRSL